MYLQDVLHIDMPPNRHWYCCLLIYTFISSFLVSCYLLIIMTFERFYSIIRPHKAASFNTVKRARIIIVFIFVSGFSFSIPYFFIVDNIGNFCVPNQFASDNGFGELYYWLTEIFIFIFPFLSLLIMNSIIINTLRERSRLNLSAGQGKNQSVKVKHSEQQIVTMLLLVSFVFLILNLPVRALVFYLNFSTGNTPQYYAGLYLFNQIGEKSFYTSHGINFFLYVISGQKFRTDLRNLFILQK